MVLSEINNYSAKLLWILFATLFIMEICSGTWYITNNLFRVFFSGHVSYKYIFLYFLNKQNNIIYKNFTKKKCFEGDETNSPFFNSHCTNYRFYYQNYS